MSRMNINGVVYVPEVSVQKLDDDRMLRCIKALIRIRDTSDLDSINIIALDAIEDLSLPMANLVAKNPVAARERVEEMLASHTAVPYGDGASPKFTRKDMVEMIPVVVSDLKHEPTPAEREVTNSNIRNGLYKYVIRHMYDESTFAFKATDTNSHQTGMFVKGYVRDVWSYLGDAYDLIHGEDFIKNYAAEIAQGQK